MRLCIGPVDDAMTCPKSHQEKVLFLAFVFFMLGCQSVRLIAFFYTHWWVYWPKEANKSFVIDSGLKPIMQKIILIPRKKNGFRTATRFTGLRPQKLKENLPSLWCAWSIPIYLRGNRKGSSERIWWLCVEIILVEFQKHKTLWILGIM